MNARSPATLFACVLLCACLWGNAFPSIKGVYGHWQQQGLDIGIYDRWLFAGIRFTIAGLGLLLIARRPWAEWKQTPIRYLAVLSLGQTFLQYVFFYIGLSLASGSLGALMASTGSFWWMLVAPLMLGVAWPGLRQWCGLIVGAVGVTMAVYAPGTGGEEPFWGALCVILSTLFGSIGIVIFTKIKPTMGARAATGFSLFFGGLGLCLVGFPAWSGVMELFDAYVVGMTVWLACISAVGFAVWNQLSTLYPVSVMASCRFFIPICGVVQSLVLLDGESAGWGLWVGGILVIASALYATLNKCD